MPVIDQAVRFRNELARHETQATNQAINAYKLLVNRLEDKLTVLQSKFEVLEAKKQLTPENVRKLGVWSSLLNQVEDEITKYGGYVDTNNRLAATRSIEMASKHAEKLTAIHFEDKPNLTKAFNASWDRLPTESVETLLGFLQEDSPLRSNLTRSLGSNAAQNFQDKLLEGIGLGYNPNKINSLINQTLGEPLSWSLNTIRTTQLYSYREATRANYINNSEIVGGWKWYAALDGRTCMSCVNQHGRDFPVIASLNDHHQGRCTQIPLVDKPERFGLKPLEIETGEKWFNNLPQSRQVEMMGQERHKAYKQGKFRFDDLSESYDNDTFGTMLKEASLKSILVNRPEPTISIPKPTPKAPTKPTLPTRPTASKPAAKPLTQSKPSNMRAASEMFRLDSSLTQELRDAAKEALELIEKVHGFPKSADKIAIVDLKGMKQEIQGVYRQGSGGEPLDIGIAKTAVKPTMTTIHEVGHYLDYHVISGLDMSLASTSSKFEDWRIAVENTKAYKKLQSMVNDPDKNAVDKGGYTVKPNVEYTEYLLQHNELWARSYMQYIMTKNGRASAMSYYTQDPLYGSVQWDKDDFTEVEKAFDKMLEKYK